MAAPGLQGMEVCAAWNHPDKNHASILADEKVLFDFTPSAADMVPEGANEKGNFIHIIFRIIFLVILPGYISLVDYTKQITPL